MSDDIQIKDANDDPVDVATRDKGGREVQLVQLDMGNGSTVAPAEGFLPVAAPGGDPLASEATLEAVRALVELIRDAIKLEDSASANGDPGMVVLAQRRDTDAPSAGTDGDYTTLKMDEAGRLKVAAQPASYPLTTGAITASGQTAAVACSRASNVVVHMVATSLVGHNCTFEGSIDSTDGANGAWFAIQAVRTNANTIELTTGVLAATPAYAWELSVNGLSYARVRATAHTSGTATWKFQPAPYATEPIPASQVSATQPVSGTVVLGAGTARVGFAAAAGIWYDDTVTALGSNATFTGTSRDLTVTATATAMANAGTYAKEVRASAESDVSGRLWLEVSRDNTNWRRIKSVATQAVTGGGHYAEIVHQPSWRYARVGFTNDAVAQARLTVGTMLMAA
jgi:hypothetical protein